MGFFDKMKAAFNNAMADFTGENEEAYETLEEMLILSDAGMDTTEDIMEKLRRRVRDEGCRGEEQLRKMLASILTDTMDAGDNALHLDTKPSVILVVGVNGVGKTTTIGKLASRLTAEGKSVLLCAGDTFRAAAVEQLQLWGERTDSQVVSARHGADPASVAYDATQAALARNADYLLIDTAGRQHNQKGLMDELAKIRRSIEKVYPGAPHEVWLTVDASLGGNVLNQAREFSKTTGVTGLVLTKLDGTGKGGMVVALHQEFELPTFFIGLGEQPEDLQPFSPEYYADALFGEEAPREE